MALLDFISARIPTWESNYCGSPPKTCDAATLRADYAYPRGDDSVADPMAASVREAAKPDLGLRSAATFGSHSQW